MAAHVNGANGAHASQQPDPTTNLHWNDYKGAIHEIFADNAAKFPRRECIIETPNSRHKDSRVFTYGQIDESSNQLAYHLIDHGCEVNDVVMIYAYRGVDLVVAYMGALKAGATVSVLDPQYPADRQKILLDVAKPRFLIYIQRATEESGEPAATVTDFIRENLQIKATIPALALQSDGTLQGGQLNGSDCLAPQASRRTQRSSVQVGPDCNPTLSFTSGSEGRPKGVLGRHFSLTHYFPWMATEFDLSENDRFTMLSGIAHDPIQRDIFTPLFLGAKLVIPPAEAIAYELLAEWMGRYEVTVTHLTPAMGQIVVGGASAEIGHLKKAFFVGDLLTKKDCRKLRDLAPKVDIINLYGSTESQRAVSYFPIPNAEKHPDVLEDLPDIMPVGQGMQHVQLLVVNQDDRSKLCGVGEVGELFIRAAGLSGGYLGDDERSRQLNESKFLTNWFVHKDKWQPEYIALEKKSEQPWMKYYDGPRDRIYRTGDLGRMRKDGSVECTGRIDLQVKIRGFRIELGEIDVNLSQHPFVRENVTVVRRDRNEEQTLVTYYVPEIKRWVQHLQEQGSGHSETAVQGEESIDESMESMLRRFASLSEECKAFLATKVPKYAVPTIFIPLARMPLNPNGKIDRPSLPFPDPAELGLPRKRRTSSVNARMSDSQKRLAAIWAQPQILNRSERMIVPTSNFFEEGGDSIKAQEMFFLLKREFTDIELPITVIFSSPTLEGLSRQIDRARDPIGLRLDVNPLPGDERAEDEAYAADARDLVKKLPEKVERTSAGAGADWPAAANNAANGEARASPKVFLTGATGFLGSFILRELLSSPLGCYVIAHVRAKDLETARSRIESSCRAYGFWDPKWLDRLEVMTGDISKPQLGLETASWQHISSWVDVIIHNGAQVNWMLPYSSLRAANVLSTLDCIRLCAAEAKAKKLVFVSSTSTLDNDYFVQQSCEGKPVSEDDDLESSRKGLATGYGQSKWASEFLVREAGNRGLEGSIMRPGYVTGDPATGVSVTDDFLVRLWKGCLQIGARPDIANSLNAVPVTRVAEVAVAAAFVGLNDPKSKQAGGVSVAQVNSHPRMSLNDWIGAMERYGYEVPQIEYRAWTDKVKKYVSAGEGQDQKDKKEPFALLPLFHYVVGDLPAGTVAPELDDANARAVVKGWEEYKANARVTANGSAGDHGKNGAAAQSETVGEPEGVTSELLGVYIAYLVAVGFLPAPTKSGEGVQALPKVDEEKLRGLAAAGAGGRGSTRS